MMNWEVEFEELIPFLGKTIYRPKNVLVELCANSYDADASIVEIITRGESEQVLIKDNGCGMDHDDIRELVTIAKSKKRKMVRNNQTTPVFNRKLLGSFGIGIVSFITLGDFIRIFTLKEGNTPIYLEIRKVFDDEGEIKEVEISDPIESWDYKQHLLDPASCASGTTIEINNQKIDFIRHYSHIQHKLSNLPLSNDFKIKLNSSEVMRDDFCGPDWISREFDFTLDNVDPTYQSRFTINVNHQATIEPHKRGIYLTVNGRVIEKDLYAVLYPDLTSPATIAARVQGFIEADYLEKSIQANREDFFDSEIVDEIRNRIKSFINTFIEDYIQQRYTEEKEQSYNDLLQRIEKAKNKHSAPNQYLSELELNFASNPEFESEVVLIIAQLCQKGILPFQILDYSSSSHIDCIVNWPITQSNRHPNFVSELEIETSLDHFFEHRHDFRTKPDICCWQIKQADFERKKRRYIESHPESIAAVELRDATDAQHFGHQKELHFTVQEEHNVLNTIILRVYVLSQIVQELCTNRS